MNSNEGLENGRAVKRKTSREISKFMRSQEREELISIQAIGTCASAERRYTLLMGKKGGALVKVSIS